MNVGILAIECYFPKRYVPQTALEAADGCEGKYTIGLGQEALALFDDREDVGSLLLNALANLLEKYGIEPASVGRLEVGTETLIDKSKSIKTALLKHLFEGCTDVEGVTSTNACYGGTAALLNSVAWVESSSWDGRFAIVVCGDIAVYAPGPARPTGGGGAIAMLIGPDAPLCVSGLRATHAVEVYDFYKPRGDTEYATVDGKLSQAAYLSAVDHCYAGLKKKQQLTRGIDSFDYVCMHSPYNKLVQKGFARILYVDFADSPELEEFSGDAQRWRGVPAEATLNDRDTEKCFVGLSKQRFATKCSPSDSISRQIGNSYTAAVYMNLLSLVCNVSSGLEGKRIMMFSYGSGAVATAFTIMARTPTNGSFTLARIAETANVSERLAARTAVDVETLNSALGLREAIYGVAGFSPSGELH
eukprot:CAMPEP_0119305214 /NCGR_PEP_ID=MMETSP1333-20130426/6262_1 /TAXON_ID=418940 /ORGANISM="Scyphosphaera apsteinii, Strain RCC1455" /LENGTH=416 /DNA_ID=CAMNT_0007308247 /DNA_START=27 /DNA_END=1274 /DNA_ORIENTATION=-